MTLESIEKLRNWMPISVISDTAMNIGREYADAIQVEVDEKYMELPVDADGVPIRIFDEVTGGMGDSGKVVRLELWNDGWVVVYKVAAGRTTRYSPDAVSHVKPRTVEDVLNDFASEAYDVDGRDDEEWLPLLAKYAAELQMRGDAE